MWGRVAEMCRIVSSQTRDCLFSKADNEAAYKQLPLDWGQTNIAAIYLIPPHYGRFYGLTSRTLMFGSIADVIHYDVFSRILAELMRRIFGIPMISYFDDFGALLPASPAIRGLEVFTQWWQLLRIPLN